MVCSQPKQHPAIGYIMENLHPAFYSNQKIRDVTSPEPWERGLVGAWIQWGRWALVRQPALIILEFPPAVWRADYGREGLFTGQEVGDLASVYQGGEDRLIA